MGERLKRLELALPAGSHVNLLNCFLDTVSNPLCNKLHRLLSFPWVTHSHYVRVSLHTNSLYLATATLRFKPIVAYKK